MPPTVRTVGYFYGSAMADVLKYIKRVSSNMSNRFNCTRSGIAGERDVENENLNNSGKSETQFCNKKGTGNKHFVPFF